MADQSDADPPGLMSGGNDVLAPRPPPAGSSAAAAIQGAPITSICGALALLFGMLDGPSYEPASFAHGDSSQEALIVEMDESSAPPG